MKAITDNYFGDRLNWKRTSFVLLLLFGALIILIPVVNHYYFRTYAFDYGAYNFAFYDYAHFSVSPNPVYPYPNTTFMQDHLSFTLFFLTPFYWLLKWSFGSYTLLIIQSLFVIWGGWASRKLIVEKTCSELFGFLTLLLYFTLYGRYSAFSGDCNLMIILSTFVPVFLLYFERGKTWITVGCFLFLILGRESMPLWTFFICIFLMILNRKEREKFRLAAYLCLASVVYFIIAFKLLIPALESPDRPFDLFTYGKLGDTPFEALGYIFRHPINTFELLFINQSGDPYYNGVKGEFYFVYLISGGILLILRPYYVIAFIPIIAQKMFNDFPIRWGIASYYGVEIVSLLPILVFMVLGSMKHRKIAYFLGGVACIMSISITLYKFDPQNRTLEWAGIGKMNPFESAFYDSEYPAKKIHKILDKIPSDARVSATGNVVPHLALREHIYYFPRSRGEVDYIIILNCNNHFLMSQEQLDHKIDSLSQLPIYTTIMNDKDILIFKRKAKK